MATIQKCIWLVDGKKYDCFERASLSYVLIDIIHGWYPDIEYIHARRLPMSYLDKKMWAVGFSEIKLLNKIYLGGE